MRWLLLALAAAAGLWCWRRATYRDLNEDSVRRRLAALMPPIPK